MYLGTKPKSYNRQPTLWKYNNGSLNFAWHKEAPFYINTYYQFSTSYLVAKVTISKVFTYYFKNRVVIICIFYIAYYRFLWYIITKLVEPPFFIYIHSTNMYKYILSWKWFLIEYLVFSGIMIMCYTLIINTIIYILCVLLYNNNFFVKYFSKNRMKLFSSKVYT